VPSFVPTTKPYRLLLSLSTQPETHAGQDIRSSWSQLMVIRCHKLLPPSEAGRPFIMH